MSSPPAGNVASVIVAYNSEPHLSACAAAAPGTVWIIDNSPQPKPAPPGTHYQPHPENLGFAGAVNRGFALSQEPLVLVLNPDCVVQGGVSAMIAEFADPRVGAVGGKLVDPDGQVQQGFTVRRFPTAWTLAFEILGVNRLFPTTAVNRRYRCADLDLTQAQEVDQPAGAFLMVRRTAWQAIGGFDQRFHPVWFEDVDFCKRLKTAGWAVRYTPEAVAAHVGGHSVNRMPVASRMTTWYGSLQRYAEKHLPLAGRWLIAVSLLVSVVPRGVSGLFREGSLVPLWVQARIATQAVKRLIFEESGT